MKTVLELLVVAYVVLLIAFLMFRPKQKLKQIQRSTTSSAKPYFDKPRAKIMHNPFDNYWRWAVLNPEAHVWEWKRTATSNEMLDWFRDIDNDQLQYGIQIASSEIEHYNEVIPPPKVYGVAGATILNSDGERIPLNPDNHLFIEGDVIAKCARCQGRRDDEIHRYEVVR